MTLADMLDNEPNDALRPDEVDEDALAEQADEAMMDAWVDGVRD